IVRLEAFGDDGDAAAVALTERFVEVMEAEHRELGLGDPTLGKTVRKLVGSLARRVELWRAAREKHWADAARESLYKGDVQPQALAHGARALRDLRAKLGRCDLAALTEGRFG